LFNFPIQNQICIAIPAPSKIPPVINPIPKPVNQRLLALRAGKRVCFFKNGGIGFVGEIKVTYLDA